MNDLEFLKKYEVALNFTADYTGVAWVVDGEEHYEEIQDARSLKEVLAFAKREIEFSLGE